MTKRKSFKALRSDFLERVIMVVLILSTVISQKDLVLKTIIPTTIRSEEHADISEVEQLYNRLPDNVKASFEEGNWQIVVCKDIAVDTSSGKTKGSLKIIKIEEEHADCFYHEIGHFIDINNNDASTTIVFQAIVEKEIEKAKNIIDYKYVINNKHLEREYFAECTKAYFVCPDSLKRNCPRTYSFIKENVETTK